MLSLQIYIRDKDKYYLSAYGVRTANTFDFYFFRSFFERDPLLRTGHKVHLMRGCQKCEFVWYMFKRGKPGL